jgi:hypothetical protein
MFLKYIFFKLLANIQNTKVTSSKHIFIYICKKPKCPKIGTTDKYILIFSSLVNIILSNYLWIITLLPFFIEMLQYDWLWSGHMIIKEMFHIPMKLKHIFIYICKKPKCPKIGTTDNLWTIIEPIHVFWKC